ncbi:GlcNAc-PI de-N-acetylase [Marinilabilia salmonicolor]|jgi:LmbE family N-acetylglucosaminyl deacetylase|uniref:PIG-L deacetylase family protein n=1 Tax=Marinilabilia salmonicolor TaxID=989 RepID=UPI000D47B2CE|nr:PIG-L family deacetylase [Marinilabilia salmonicolor]PRY98256.1 GlcNAc-PI de-N-acetylase [Marinilabilia salmonicolor]
MAGYMLKKCKKTIVVIVAHPDDETLWSGGTILSHPKCDWFIVSLCRGKDSDRSKKFFKALEALNAQGIMGDLDDEPEQKPLKPKKIETAILNLLPLKHFDMIISHSPVGEYTKHLRHEEIGRAVIKLWHTNKIAANCFWAFAYDDGNKEYLPRAIEKAPIITNLSAQIWKKKHKIITATYGFDNNSWEAQTTPKTEAFWQFGNPSEATNWLKKIK